MTKKNSKNILKKRLFTFLQRAVKSTKLIVDELTKKKRRNKTYRTIPTASFVSDVIPKIRTALFSICQRLYNLLSFISLYSSIISAEEEKITGDEEYYIQKKKGKIISCMCIKFDDEDVTTPSLRRVVYI